MRLFLAIDLPDEAKKQIDQQLAPLKKEYAVFNWLPSSNYHLTVHFFGEVPSLEPLQEKIDQTVYDIPTFRMYSLGAGLFINQKIVSYVTFRREKILEQIVDRLNEAFPDTLQKKFVPHLTVARYKIPSKQQYYLIKKKLENLEVDVEFEVNSIGLFESILSSKAPIYKKLAEFPLWQEK